MRSLLRAIAVSICLMVGLATAAMACLAIPRPIGNNVPTGNIQLTEQRALLYSEAGVEHLVLSVKYQGGTSEFAWVIPTETKPQVHVQKGSPFHELWRLTEIRRPAMHMRAPGAPEAAAAKIQSVQVVERKVEGPYELIVLRGTNGRDLYDWLARNGFSLTNDASQALDYYARKNWYFACARIRPGGESNQRIQQHLKEGTIAALHLSYKATQLSYPLRVTTGNPGDSKMEVYVIGANVRDPNFLQSLAFGLQPQGGKSFAVSGPPGLVASQGEYPTLRDMLPRGGTLHKYTGVLGTAQRNQDLVFANISPTAKR